LFEDNAMMALMERLHQEHLCLAEQVAQLSQETQAFLKVTAQQRQAMSKAQAQRLFQFHQQLQQDTHKFLGATTAKRQAMALQQMQQLSQFRQQLFTSIWGTTPR